MMEHRRAWRSGFSTFFPEGAPLPTTGMSINNILFPFPCHVIFGDRDMVRVAINDRKLHEVEIQEREYSERAISYVKYPEHRITAEIRESVLNVKLPVMLALELYRSGVLPPDEEERFSVDLDGERKVFFQVSALRYPLGSDSGEIILTLKSADHVTD
ncbi:hypothetical protein AKJ40_03465 [candidate division MSBL1 archaeon SCGC-AAA259M10]|uniref:Uncharacterized protein n=1 Tax=candidate division MSBL1 archaeon SCGC-AAA259M10 TaxID=1698270 RepID=A0A133UYQ0_9EURY|nr:hypothetical protein AKJ40_03465 [candidate division MSBL1 archaeon SCGC-AAA259M10]